MNGQMQRTTALNAICPYFTMFPLDFPMRILNRYGQPGQRVLDPFCGRGTTNFAARLSGLHTVGMDSSPVATAITAAKLDYKYKSGNAGCAKDTGFGIFS